jgi:hypothetical protein
MAVFLGYRISIITPQESIRWYLQIISVEDHCFAQIFQVMGVKAYQHRRPFSSEDEDEMYNSLHHSGGHYIITYVV